MRFPIHIRCMIRRDLPEVLAIEAAAFQFPWSREDFERCLRERNCVCLVAERNERVAGYAIFELHKHRLHLLSLAVAPCAWRQGVGTALVAKLVGKLDSRRRTRILVEIRETNLAAQKWFRSRGFRAIGVLRDFYDEWQTTEDAYLFEFDLLREARLCDAHHGKIQTALRRA
jgi:ribosomal-protein-alanine N-acetyltransferase